MVSLVTTIYLGLTVGLYSKYGTVLSDIPLGFSQYNLPFVISRGYWHMCNLKGNKSGMVVIIRALQNKPAWQSQASSKLLVNTFNAALVPIAFLAYFSSVEIDRGI